MVLRFRLLIIFVVLAYGALLSRLYDLQIIKAGYYGARANAEFALGLNASAERGRINFRDKDGNLLPAAINKDFPVIFAVPKLIEDVPEVANAVAPLVGSSPAALEKMLGNASSSYQIIQKKADPAVVDEVQRLGLKGVDVQLQTSRFYPLASVAANLLGFVGSAADSSVDAGKYGIEKFYNDTLSGTGEGNAVPGEDINVTIDPNIENEAEKLLADLVKTYNAKGGSVIVEDPKTGKILTMGSYPNFDPNSYGTSPLSSFLNPAVESIYEPGSVFKVITMATGIDAGKITPDTTYVDTGTLNINGRVISNYDVKTHGPYGKVTMTNVIEHSINTGAVFAERQIGRDIFTKYLTNFGFSQKTGIDLPGELAGNLRRLSPKEKDVAFATASYGQGVAVTPLELITAIATIANHGVMMRPYVNESGGPQVIRKVISDTTAQQVTAMMVSTVDKNLVTKIKGYTVAGKTGTAFVPDFVHGGYTTNVINTYVGFAPASDPKFIALVKLDEPQNAPLAGTSVVPAFRDLAQFILNYENIPPDRIND